jgi:hypothetical protein
MEMARRGITNSMHDLDEDDAKATPPCSQLRSSLPVLSTELRCRTACCVRGERIQFPRLPTGHAQLATSSRSPFPLRRWAPMVPCRASTGDQDLARQPLWRGALNVVRSAAPAGDYGPAHLRGELPANDRGDSALPPENSPQVALQSDQSDYSNGCAEIRCLPHELGGMPNSFSDASLRHSAQDRALAFGRSSQEEAFVRISGPLVVCGIASLSLGGCSSLSDSLRPTVPAVAHKSFVASVERAALDREQATLDAAKSDLADAHKQQLHPTDPPTLDDVRTAFADLFDGVRSAGDDKARQQVVDVEIESTGGFSAVLGQLGSKIGLLNSGMALAALGFTADGIYGPATTKLTHLKAEAMFSCMDTELSTVSEADREKALSTMSTGSDKAATAVRDSISVIDSAISRYRQRVLGQVVAAPTVADFDRFSKEYARNSELAASAGAAASRYQQKTQIALAALQQKGSETLHTDGLPINVMGLVDQLKKSGKSDNIALSIELAKTKQAFDKADADAAAAKFIDLSTKLEACLSQLQ